MNKKIIPIFFLFLFGAFPFSYAEEPPVLRKSVLDLPGNPSPFRYIRVQLMQGVTEVALKSLNPYILRDKDGKKLMSGMSIGSVKIQAVPEGIKFGTMIFRNHPLDFMSEGEGFRLGNRVYRYGLHVRKDAAGKLLLINDIPLEDYLRGVLPSEVNPHWPMESLKAQAVASRTFALFRMIQNHDQPFDVSHDVLSQVYKGRGLEHKLTDQAIALTEGQIATYQGKIVYAFFHSTCGGATVDISKIWNNESTPPLKGVECGFCAGSPHYRWTTRLSAQELNQRFRKSGISMWDVQSVSIQERDMFSRAVTLRVVGSKGERTYLTSDFRTWIGTDKIKSTFIEKIEKQGTVFIFKGRGWGHGAGLCQYGTKRLGQLGYHYDKILRFYYPGTELTQYFPRKSDPWESSS